MGVRGPAGLPTLSRRSKIIIGIAVALLIILLIGPRIVGLVTDWLWFSDLGYSEVFSTILWTRILLFVITAVIVGGIVFAAIASAYRSRPVFVPASGPGDPLARYRAAVMGRIRWFAIIPPVLIGVLSGLVAQGSWATVQTFLHSTDFGVTDPQFGIDISFYAFKLPFITFVLNFLFVIVVIAFVASLITHYVFGGIRLGGGSGSLTGSARIQLAALAGIFLLLKATAYWFDRYSLLSSDRKQEIFSGASYTDINAVLPSKLILMAIAIICALAFFAGVVLKDLRIPAIATVLMLLAALVMGVGWPLTMEQFSVKPNAAQKEAEYISRNIAATTQAYGIVAGKNVDYQNDWGATAPSAEAVNADEATLSNIRILDPNVIAPTFNQRQFLKNFYGFPSQLAIDRYKVDGQERDFIVAVRELDPTKYGDQQQNWLNKHTVYTHGNGFVAAPANQVDEASGDATSGSDRGGLPVFYVSDLQTIRDPNYAATAPIKVSQPRIYFGELISNVSPDYAIVGTSGGAREYDEDNKTYTYTADSGVSLSNWFVRAMYAVKYTERNFLLSDAINSNSRILYNRDPRDRVKQVAPWLTVDSKAYPAVMADGSIKWIVDGYTTLDNYPYSQQTSLQDATTDAQELINNQAQRSQANTQVSYVRNSVKATVDAYTGKVTLYQFDKNDPVLKTWMKVFPGTVQPRSEFDKNTSLASHVRYPEDLFKIQRELLAKYHVTDPTAFFQNNNFWSVPPDPSNEDNANRQLNQPPYYFTARNPRGGTGSDSQFQLTTVFTGFRERNLASYMTVSSDPGSYGQITMKVLPTDRQSGVGPQQAQDNMNNYGAVLGDRKQLEGTTKVTYGNLLTLPVGGGGILYVQPLYTQTNNGGGIPKLHRVLMYYNAAAGNPKVGYAATVAEALAQVSISPEDATAPLNGEPSGNQAGADQPTVPTPQPNQPSTGNGQTGQSGNNQQRDAAVAAIGDALNKLRQAQSSGDFTAYGQALDQLNKAVAQYESLGGGN
ncbi:UPF0182 family protein [Gordonia sp. N1V]|uniref:UPF0182 family protein n=1 Tax=Gordonia sp. N1V TaxID=3034163 RepID=UPI0023E10046|nr:UPF0182 family protein [Gordonia sp. N1V]MDF3284336.1 UPF0182 family protein [Gordonia sp. N1V]